MKTVICVNINRDHVYGCDTYFIGRSGENESTQFQIQLEECLCDSWVYIDFVKPDGTKYKTPRLDIVGNVVTYDVKNELLTNKGTLKAQVVLQNETGIIWKSTVKSYEIIQSIDATEAIPDKEDFITEAQKTLDDMENLKEEVETGLTPTIGDNENWFVGGKDTGKPSRGPQGASYIITDEDLKEVESNVTEDLKPMLEEIQDVADTAESIAKGANQSLSFGDYSTMISVFNSLNNDTYRVGQNILIVTLNVPDLWVSEVLEESAVYTYTTDEDLTALLKEQGYIQVGYYKLSALETQKVDLTEYVKNTDIATSSKAGIVKVNEKTYGSKIIGSGVLCGNPLTYSQYKEANTYFLISRGTLESVLNGRFATLTQEEYDALETKDENTYYYIPEV